MESVLFAQITVKISKSSMIVNCISTYTGGRPEATSPAALGPDPRHRRTARDRYRFPQGARQRRSPLLPVRHCQDGSRRVRRSPVSPPLSGRLSPSGLPRLRRVVFLPLRTLRYRRVPPPAFIPPRGGRQTPTRYHRAAHWNGIRLQSGRPGPVPVLEPIFPLRDHRDEFPVVLARKGDRRSAAHREVGAAISIRLPSGSRR